MIDIKEESIPKNYSTNMFRNDWLKEPFSSSGTDFAIELNLLNTALSDTILAKDGENFCILPCPLTI